MNFGRRIPGEKKEVKNTSITSDNVFREYNLFIPELIAIVVSLLASVGLMFFSRFYLIAGLEANKLGVEADTFIQLSNLITTTNILMIALPAIPLLLFAAFFMFRYMKFMPRNNKFLFLRIKESGAIRLSIDTLKDSVPFTNDPLSDKIRIKNPRKHWDEATGKPVVVLFEGDDSNANLNVYHSNINEKGRDTNVINDNAFDLGRRFERYIAEQKDKFMNPTNLLLVLVLAAVAFLGVKQLGII